MEPSDVITQAFGATAVAKTLVDMMKISEAPTPKWSLPLLALGFGEIAAFVMMIGNAGLDGITAQNSSIAFLQGVIAAGGAVGITELGRQGDKANVGK